MAGDVAKQGPARLILGGETPGQHFDLLAGKVEPFGKSLGGLGAGLFEGGPALLDHREHGLALRLEALARLVYRLRRPLHRSIDCAVHLGRRLDHAFSGGAGAALDPGDMRAEPLRGSARRLVRLAAARGERGELAFQRQRLLVRAEAGLLHRLGGGAGLRLDLGQVAHQHADVDPRCFRCLVQRLRLAVELAALAPELAGDPADPVGRLVA